MPGVQDIDHGYRRVMRELRSMHNDAVVIGIHGPEAMKTGDYEDAPDATRVKIAATHELGNEERNIPKRSFLKANLDQKKERYFRLAIRLLNKMLSSKATFSTRDLLELIGTRVRDDTKRYIRARIPPPLSPVTILWRVRQTKAAARRYAKGRREGKSMQDMQGDFTPLVNHGILINSITSEVRKDFKGGEDGSV